MKKVGINDIYQFDNDFSNFNISNNKISCIENKKNKTLNLPYSPTVIESQNSILIDESCHLIMPDIYSSYEDPKVPKKDYKSLIIEWFKFYKLDIKKPTLIINNSYYNDITGTIHITNIDNYEYLSLEELSTRDNKALLQLNFIKVISKIPKKKKLFKTNEYNIQIKDEFDERQIIVENIMLNPGITYAVWTGKEYSIRNTNTLIYFAYNNTKKYYNEFAVFIFLKFVQKYKCVIIKDDYFSSLNQ
jgi:tRNA A37 threonylcarbamoyladenosine biosynthesis protein TsaE